MDDALFLRLITVGLCLYSMIRMTWWTFKNSKRMLGAQYLRSWSLVAWIITVGWGTAESIYRDVPTGPRVVIAFFGSIICTVAVSMPKGYDVFDRDPKRDGEPQ